ncbi:MULTISPECIES: autotransporter domain-containing protein [unclassified Acinetobacter]|uniref:autotransporter domain-containing protein n=1 Tax=unclassified Acinetobacter TaxID=196816 RepID=UPI0035BB5BA2
MKSKFRFSTLALSFATIALSSQVMAQQFSQTIIFGDSLSDTGRLKSMVADTHPEIAAKLQNSFTVNPSKVWSQILAESYGTTANPNTKTDPKGTNYAVGSARASQNVDWNGLVTSIPTINQQVMTHLAQKQGKADSDALYAVWIGANDLNALGSAADPQAYLAKVGKDTATAVATLDATGAKYILVPNIPDLSLTPRVSGLNNPATSAQVKTATSYYNSGLYTGLNGLKANVIPANTFALLQEVVANPKGFGFTNVSGVACSKLPKRTTTVEDALSTSLACTTNDLANAGDANTYLFADDIHPAVRTHKILGQYYRSIIEAPAQIAAVSDGVIASGQRQQQSINRRLDTLNSQQNNWWIDGNVAQAQDANSKTDGVAPQVTIGTDIAKNNSNIGLYVSYANQTQQPKADQKNQADVESLGLGLYHRYQNNGYQLNLQAGVNRLDIDTQRQVAWGGAERSHQAHGTGLQLNATVRGSYGIQQDKMTYRPYIGVNYQHVKVGTLAENNPTLSTALRYKSHTAQSVQGEVGLNADYQLSEKTTAYAGVGYQRELADQDKNITATLTSIPEYSKGFTLPVASKLKKEQVSLQLGAKSQLSPALSLNAGVAAQLAGSEQHNYAGFVGLQGKF